MRMIAFLLAIVAAIAAVVYFMTSADSLPHFMPGYDPSLHATHFKHGLAAAGAAVVLFVIGWIVGRR